MNGSARSAIGMLACLGALAGCVTDDGVDLGQPSASIGLDYAHTSLGYRNSGALPAGRLMLWDVEENDLVTLESVIPMNVVSTSSPANLAATRVSGFTVAVSGGAAAAGEGEIGAAVSRDLTINVTDAVRELNSEIYTALSNVYRARVDQGVDAHQTWRVAQATGEPARYKYVVLTDPVRASRESISFRNARSGSAGVSLIPTGAGAVQVSIPEETVASCERAGEERALCFFTATVLEASLVNGNLSYAPASFSERRLAGAFRGL